MAGKPESPPVRVLHARHGGGLGRSSRHVAVDGAGHGGLADLHPGGLHRGDRRAGMGDRTGWNGQVNGPVAVRVFGRGRAGEEAGIAHPAHRHAPDVARGADPGAIEPSLRRQRAQSQEPQVRHLREQGLMGSPQGPRLRAATRTDPYATY